jgi:hypothetical protein
MKRRHFVYGALAIVGAGVIAALVIRRRSS